MRDLDHVMVLQQGHVRVGLDCLLCLRAWAFVREEITSLAVGSVADTHTFTHTKTGTDTCEQNTLFTAMVMYPAKDDRLHRILDNSRPKGGRGLLSVNVTG
jgi:hypothetical protein